MNETIDIRSAIRRRISVRHYARKPVPDNILEDVITSGEESVAELQQSGLLAELAKDA
jgi:nitroreductase